MTLLSPRAPFQVLAFGAYDLADIDPPWPNQNRSPKGETKSSVAQYGRMSWEEIYGLPVADLLARNALVRLWATWPLLLHGGDVKRHYKGHDASISKIGACFKHWGLRYVTGGAWRKLTVHGKVAFPNGYRVRPSCEPFLLAVKGSPKTANNLRNIFDGLAREHSRKPDEGVEWLERLKPDAQRKVELFSRQNRPGWDSWGYEKGKFDPVVHFAEAA
jgi:N6-adenosine-specific RNA methylase IME4